MTTKYEIIKRDIINQIEDGTFLPGEKIYSEGDLRKIYKVSSTTVIKALNDLVSKGYLIRRQGEETYVRKNIKHRRVLFSEQMLMNDLSNVKKVREETRTFIEEKEESYISKVLGDINANNPIINIIQVALMDDKP
ncbi:TPA: GntR family transcriptional regulator [Enterococcus hirae]